MSDNQKGKRKPGNPNLVKGVVLNPTGRPRGLSAFQMQLREDHDPAEMSAIVKAIYRGEPFVRVMNSETMQPRLASAPIRAEDNPGYARPVPADGVILGPNERIMEVVWPTASEQMAAMKFVAEYAGWKPAGEVNMNVSHSTSVADIDPDDLSDEELENYLNTIDMLKLAKARSANPEQEPFSSGSHILDVPSTVKEE